MSWFSPLQIHGAYSTGVCVGSHCSQHLYCTRHLATAPRGTEPFPWLCRIVTVEIDPTEQGAPDRPANLQQLQPESLAAHAHCCTGPRLPHHEASVPGL